MKGDANGPGLSSVPSDRVPTLTEVVQWPAAPAAAIVQGPRPAPPVVAAPSATGSVVAPSADARPAAAAPLAMSFVESGLTSSAAIDELMTQRILADLQRQIELMLEYRLRETLAPLLTRATDAIVRDARNELASTLRDVVARAVADELARHRPR